MELVIHTDGGSRGNPGPSAAGVTIYSGTTPLAELSSYLGAGTNNNAEYAAVVLAFQWLVAHPQTVSKAAFYLDSQLVVSQLNGIFAVKHPDMKRLKSQVDAMRKTLPYPVSFSYVPRAQNSEADALVNQALDQAASL